MDVTGADGLIPIRTLNDDYYIHDETHHFLKGRQTGREFRLGENVNVRLDEASTTTGGMIFSLIEKKKFNKTRVKNKKKNSKLRSN